MLSSYRSILTMCSPFVVLEVSFPCVICTITRSFRTLHYKLGICINKYLNRFGDDDLARSLIRSVSKLSLAS